MEEKKFIQYGKIALVGGLMFASALIGRCSVPEYKVSIKASKNQNQEYILQGYEIRKIINKSPGREVTQFRGKGEMGSNIEKPFKDGNLEIELIKK